MEFLCLASRVFSPFLVRGVSAVLRPVNQTEHTDGRTDGRDRGAMLLGENQDEEEDEDGAEVESRKHTEETRDRKKQKGDYKKLTQGTLFKSSVMNANEHKQTKFCWSPMKPDSRFLRIVADTKEAN